jgi:hypothetical protein
MCIYYSSTGKSLFSLFFDKKEEETGASALEPSLETASDKNHHLQKQKEKSFDLIFCR